MPVGIRKTGPAISQLDLAGFEKLLGVPLPADYGEFLLKYNGGRPKDHIIRSTERGDVDVKIFFGIRADEFYDILADRETMRNRMPSRLLSIATDDFGNRYCLSLGEPD